MTIPSITPPPPMPIRSNYSSDAAYSAAVDIWMAWWATQPAEYNAMGEAIDDALAAAVAAATGSTIGTSGTAVTIGTGSKGPFTTQANKNWALGTWLTLTSAADPTKWLFGYVTAYSGTSLTLTVTATNGAGSPADWIIALAGPRGISGINGTNGVDGADGRDPDWVQQGSTVSTSSGTSWTFTSIPQTLTDLRFLFEGLSLAANGGQLQMAISTNNGGAWSSAYYLSGTALVAANSYYGAIEIAGYRLGAGVAHGAIGASTGSPSGASTNYYIPLAWRATGGINAVRFSIFGGGTGDAGTIKLFAR